MIFYQPQTIHSTHRLNSGQITLKIICRICIGTFLSYPPKRGYKFKIPEESWIVIQNKGMIQCWGSLAGIHRISGDCCCFFGSQIFHQIIKSRAWKITETPQTHHIWTRPNMETNRVSSRNTGNNHENKTWRKEGRIMNSLPGGFHAPHLLGCNLG